MNAQDPIFTVRDRWGDEIALTQEDWSRIVSKRPGVEGYEEHVRLTLESPTMVWEGGYDDSKVFYKKGLLDEDPLSTERSNPSARKAAFALPIASEPT